MEQTEVNSACSFFYSIFRLGEPVIQKETCENLAPVQSITGFRLCENVIARRAAPKQSLYFQRERLLRFARNDGFQTFSRTLFPSE
jgi:hypothetical protein